MRLKDLTTYCIIIFLSLLFLFIGNRIAVSGLTVFYNDSAVLTIEAKVVRVFDVNENYDDLFIGNTVTFDALITSRSHRGEIVTATQTFGVITQDLAREVSEGDRVILTRFENNEWYFMDYVRINQILILGAALAVMMLIFGRIKGITAILSLGLTCIAIFAVFIPSILSGKNIYISVMIVCVYSVVVTLLLVNGVNKKSLAAITGCLGGVVAAGILTLFMNRALLLSGMVDGESIHLLFLPTENPIDLHAIIFAGIIIGAVGAVMDVAVSISAALWELKLQAPAMTFKSIYKSGISIGKDIMGSMTNTLVLAYIGSSLTTILLLIVHAHSLTELLNRELVIVELLQAVVGSMGILLTMPLTALVCALLFSRKSEDTIKQKYLHDDYS